MEPFDKTQGEKFVLIDGNAILHRAYHALPPFTTSDGKPVGAVFGFTSMLLKVLSDLKPTYIAVAFDRAAPTFRQELFVGYQAGRPAMEDELVMQVEGVHEVVEALNIPVFEVDGYEADDVIGTLANQAIRGKSLEPSKTKEKTNPQALVTNNLEVIIVSGDRDLLQLVNFHVRMYAPIKGLSEAKMYDGEAVREKYGIEPGQIVDMKALTGDASDQYPGVRGIGPKTASTLLQKYGTLENLYKNLGELSEKVRAALTEGAESATLAKKLATIVTDVPIRLKLKDCQFHVKDKEKAIQTLRSFEFRTLTDRFIALLEGRPVESTEPTKSTLNIARKPKKQDDTNQLRLV